MGHIEFYAFFIKYWDIYIYSFVLCFFIYYLTYKKVLISLLDPLNLSIFFSFLAASVVFFLFFIGEINTYYFLSYCLTQIAFTFGFFVFKPIKINELNLRFGNEIKIEGELLFLQILFLVSSSMHIMSQLYVYHLVGIPLLMESYLEAYTGGGGIGTFARIITASTIISWYLLIHFFVNKKSRSLKIYLWFYTVMSLVFFVLSGSKGTFLTIGFILFLYTLINGRFNLIILQIRKKVAKLSLKLFYLVCIMILGIIIFKDNQGVNPFLMLGIRLIHSGDAYFYGYPNDVLKDIKPASGFSALFSDILGMFRIVEWDKLPPPFGMTLYRYHYPLTEIMNGANARHNIYGLFYFGYIGSILFSFVLGFIVSFCRNFLFRNIKRNTLFGLFYTLLYMGTNTFETDINLALFMLNSYAIGFILIFVFALTFFFMYKTSNLIKLKSSILNK